MTDKKSKSKSSAKRIKFQKGEDLGAQGIVRDPKPDSVCCTDRIKVLEARVYYLTAKVKILTDAPQFIADEARPVYGLGAVALIFDAIARKLK